MLTNLIRRARAHLTAPKPAKGIDVSMHQGSIDWRAVKRAGYRFAWVKATEGQDYVDPRFFANVVAARRAGVQVGAYHFLRPKPGRSGADEAVDFCRALRTAKFGPGDLRPVCDVEVSELGKLALADELGAAGEGDGYAGKFYQPSGELTITAESAAGRALGDYVESFLDEVERRHGTRPLIYTYPAFASWASTHGTGLWIAHYGVSAPLIPHPWTRFEAWQHSSSGHVPGIKGRVDASTTMDLGRLVIPKAKPKPKPKPKPTMGATELQRTLRKIGWPLKVDGKVGPKTTTALRDFQRGWVGPTGGRVLTVDGKLDPRTIICLRYSAEHGGMCSPHFRYREFASRRSGWIRVERELVVGLEQLRKISGPIAILSAYRDYTVPGQATDSQHAYGTAIDPVRPLPRWERVRDLRVFSGIGYQGSTGLVRHVDVRHAGPRNTTHSTVRNPALWTY